MQIFSTMKKVKSNVKGMRQSLKIIASGVLCMFSNIFRLFAFSKFSKNERKVRGLSIATTIWNCVGIFYLISFNQLKSLKFHL